MNCPQEILIYKTRAHSYRELPIRFADYSVLFRKELTGALSGMFRVRQLVQDDSHVFCRDDQVIDEINLALDLVRRQFAPFGITPSFKLATRPEKRLGSDEFWDMAEGKLKTALEESGTPYAIDPGGAAFYAPKIDIFFEDALGREWQNATVQIDYQLPQRFELEYRAADGGSERPAIIHYAIYGCSSASSAVITEHFAGAFPLWLAPVQVMVIPIADRHVEYAASVRDALTSRRPARGDRRPLGANAGQAARRPGAEDPRHAGGWRSRRRGRRVSPRLRTGECIAGRAVGRVRGRPRRPCRAPRAVAICGRDGRGAGDRRPRMRKMRGVGQLALASTDPVRVAEFYESAFGFKRRATDDGGVDLELGRIRAQLPARREAQPRRAADRLPARHRQRGGRLGPGAGATRLRGGGAAIGRPIGGHALVPRRRSRGAPGRHLLRLPGLSAQQHPGWALPVATVR